MALWQPTNADAGIQAAGTVVRAGAVADTVVLALADSQANAANLVGSRIADVAAGDPGQVEPFAPGIVVRMLSEPNLNDKIYLSAVTPGCGDTAVPALEIFLGVCSGKTQIGGIWYARLLPPGAFAATENDVLVQGTALTNADVVINPDTDAASRYVLPAGTLTAAHKVTITPGGVITLPLMGRIVRADHSAHDYTVENGGTNGAAAMSVVLPTPPAGKNLALDWVWDGTDFISNGTLYLLP